MFLCVSTKFRNILKPSNEALVRLLSRSSIIQAIWTESDDDEARSSSFDNGGIAAAFSSNTCSRDWHDRHAARR
ncbi:hypothetical protein F8388_011630 [Cannabis sativa]|uniref:Uncharacterized protein n=1 Tax=Cannabis sativa TaxID=3483 RepID=A0A7J6GX08_CANSA|nr:hypothetical protein G4B88_015183 [Cannabis sativa]KAF4387482.1 hypothetical protein F8388_011630 [Cannabis sativa]